MRLDQKVNRVRINMNFHQSPLYLNAMVIVLFCFISIYPLFARKCVYIIIKFVIVFRREAAMTNWEGYPVVIVSIKFLTSLILKMGVISWTYTLYIFTYMNVMLLLLLGYVFGMYILFDCLPKYGSLCGVKQERKTVESSH